MTQFHISVFFIFLDYLEDLNSIANAPFSESGNLVEMLNVSTVDRRPQEQDCGHKNWIKICGQHHINTPGPDVLSSHDKINNSLIDIVDK